MRDNLSSAFKQRLSGTLYAKFTGRLLLGLQLLPTPSPYINDGKCTLQVFQEFEHVLQISRPVLRYNELLPMAYKAFETSIKPPKLSEEEVRQFGSRTGAWPAFLNTGAGPAGSEEAL